MGIPNMVAALEGPDRGRRSTPSGVGVMGGDVIRRLHLRLLTAGPCRGRIRTRLILALIGQRPGLKVKGLRHQALKGRTTLGRMVPVSPFPLPSLPLACGIEYDEGWLGSGGELVRPFRAKRLGISAVDDPGRCLGLG